MEKETVEFVVSNYLESDEKMLWSAKPIKKMKLLPGEKFNVILGLAWTAFAVAWLVISLNVAKDLPSGFSIEKILPAFGVPFLMIGLYLALLSPIAIIVSRKGIEYALTTKRVIILHCGKREKLFSYTYDRVKNLNFACDEEGNGYVTFMATKTKKNGKPAVTKVQGFYNVEKVKMLYKVFSSRTENN